MSRIKLLRPQVVGMVLWAAVTWPMLANGVNSKMDGAQEEIASITASGEPVHAIISSISVGEKPPFEGPKGEFPIRRAVGFKKDFKDPFQVMINGVVQSLKQERIYADALQQWEGQRAYYHQILKKLSKNHGMLSLLLVTDKNERILIPLTNEGLRTNNKIVTIDKPPIYYSKKQKRLLLTVTPHKNITQVGLDTSAMDKEFVGFFRINILAGPGSIDGTAEHRFEEYRKPEKSADGWDQSKGWYKPTQVGMPLELSELPRQDDLVFKGRFLCPVGFSFKQAESRTKRFLNLKPGSRAKVEISGLFMFSSYYPFGPEKTIGGGGGLQDYGWRFDYVRSGEFMKEPYPIAFKQWFSFIRDDQRIILYNAKGQEIEISKVEPRIKGGKMASRHSYVITFETPKDLDQLPLHFFISDGSIPKTWDNCGALWVRILE